MNCTDCTRRLHDYVDGELRPGDARSVEEHVVHCPDCRRQLDALQSLLARTAALPREIAPPDDRWRELRAGLEPTASARAHATPRPPPDRPHPGRPAPRPSFVSWFAPLAVAAAVAFLATSADRSADARDRRPAWSVANVAGAPRIDTRAVRQEAPFRIGQWLETDATSRAKIAVGSIGEVKVEPNSRLRLVDVAATDHRIALERGTLHALIWAPPRLFFVNTPSATAVDLGCAYTLKVDDDGNGELHVTTGYVALEDGGREAVIPRGMMCVMRRGAGPGTPFTEDAPVPLKTALAQFDFAAGPREPALRAVLGAAREEDAITLWHLLARTEAADRPAVFDVLAKLSPPPTGVTREGILAGDVPMRRAWAAELGLGSFAPR